MYFSESVGLVISRPVLGFYLLKSMRPQISILKINYLGLNQQVLAHKNFVKPN